MTVTPVDFANKLKQHLGYAYRVGPSRCTGSSGYHDCSGYMCWAMNQLGMTRNLCTSSFAISIWCYDLGLRIGEDEARHTDGVFAVRGADFGRVSGGAVNGSDGHIAAAYVSSFGGTYEAMGRRYGVVRGAFDNRGWSAFYKIPGMHYGPPPPPPPPPAPEIKEFDMVILPGVPRPESRIRCAVNAPNGQAVYLMNGAKVLGMDAPHSGDPAERRRWYPKNADGSKAATTDLPLIGLTKDAKYLIALRLDGGIYRGEIDAS